MPAPPERPAAPAKANDGPLALVVENGDAATAGLSRPAAPPASGGACVRAGKFKDRAAAARAAEWMQSLGAEAVEMRHEKNRVVKSYRVYLPASPTAEAAAAKLRELRGKGIRDVAIIGKGARANQISLGVYKRRKNTRHRVAELKKLGYSALSAANTKTLSEYAIGARTGGSRSAFRSAWTARFPRNPIRYVDCP